MADDPVGPGASPRAGDAPEGSPGDDGSRRPLEALELLLAEQRFRVGQYIRAHAVPVPPTPQRPRTPPRPSPVPEQPQAQELLDALPLAAMLIRPVLDERGAVEDFCYVGQNTAAREFTARTVPPEILPPWSGSVPLFERFPNLADTPVPRLLSDSYRTGRPQGPEPAEWSLPGAQGQLVRVSSEVRVAPCGGLLLLTWERGERDQARMVQAVQHLAKVCWAEWNLGDGTVEEAGLREVLGLPAGQRPPGLVDLARMMAPDSREPLYRALRDVLLGERDVLDLELCLTSPEERILRLIAEPVRPETGPVWTVRAVCRDVTADVRARVTAERAVQEARAQRERADTVAEVAERLRAAVLPGFPAELARRGVEAAAVYRPDSQTARVGGDWYKTRVLPSGQVLIALGDARGHGLDAVTLMAKLRHALAGLAFTGEGVERLTSWLNEVACDDGEESTATAVIARYHPARGLLRWTCAGHPLPVLVRDRRARLLEPPPGGPGLALGVQPGEAYAAAETPLIPGDVVLLYSDGLIERRGSDLDRDSSRLLRAVDDSARDGIPPGGEALDQYIRALVRALTGPHVADDATVLAFRLLRAEPDANDLP